MDSKAFSGASLAELSLRLEHLRQAVGNTPMFAMRSLPGVYAKLEWLQYAGSIKVRPALYILQRAFKEGNLTPTSTVVESSSGNFAVALALICRFAGLKFIAVVDPCIAPQRETLLRKLCYDVVKVTSKDETGSFLASRLSTVENLKRDLCGAFHPNQYSNEANALSYYSSLASELIAQAPGLEFCAISVSTGGTLAGLSRRLKLFKPEIKIIAVDVEGSAVFSHHVFARKLTGLGSGRKSDFLSPGMVDDVVILSEGEILAGCREFFDAEGLIIGPSAGATYAASKKLIVRDCLRGPGVLIFPDCGMDYLDSHLEHVF